MVAFGGFGLMMNKQQIRQSFNKAVSTYDQAAVLQREIGQRLLERVDVDNPQYLLDMGCGTGVCAQQLLKQFPRSRLFAVDLADQMVQATRHRIVGQRPAWWPGGAHKRLFPVCADMEALPLAKASMDLVFSNVSIQWCHQPEQVFNECRRILKPGGRLLLTTFGPETLQELRHSWAAVDDAEHVNQFTDIHDLGDMLYRAGFVNPVLDIDRFTLTYPDVYALMRDLKKIGAHHMGEGRSRALTGRERLRKMAAAYEALRRDGKLPATYEVITASAWQADQPVGSQAVSFAQ